MNPNPPNQTECTLHGKVDCGHCEMVTKYMDKVAQPNQAREMVGGITWDLDGPHLTAAAPNQTVTDDQGGIRCWACWDSGIRPAHCAHNCPNHAKSTAVPEAPPAPVEALCTNEFDLCNRCGVGIDDDHDGNCGFCAKMSDGDLVAYLRLLVKLERVKFAKPAFAYSPEMEKLVAAINWACGCGDEDFCPPLNAKAHPPYWWRTELIRRAGLIWSPEDQSYIKP